MLLVAGIPVAAPAVFSTVLAISAHKLAQMKALYQDSLVLKISPLWTSFVRIKQERSPKTNSPLDKFSPLKAATKKVLISACLASKQEGTDSIDEALFQYLNDKETLNPYHIVKHIPFDPVRKRVEAIVTFPDHSGKQIMKGAPQVVFELCKASNSLEQEVMKNIELLASKGLRTLGIAESEDGKQWQFLGLIAFLDPPREDTAEVLSKTQSIGVYIKMVSRGVS